MSTTPRAPSREVGDFYSALGPLLSLVWDENFHFGWWDGGSETSVATATDRLTDELVRRLEVLPGGRVLDLGCGVGKPALRIAAATGASVLGVSVNAAQVADATARAAAAGRSGQIAFTTADATALPFPDASFDAVFALESLIHMDRQVALREAARVLVPGGRLVLTDLTRPDVGDPEADASAAVTSLVRFTAYPGLLRAAGLELDELLDISEYTRPTMPRLVDNIRSHRAEFEMRYGFDLTGMIAATSSPLVAATDIGCLIAVAHRAAGVTPGRTRC